MSRTLRPCHLENQRGEESMDELLLSVLFGSLYRLFILNLTNFLCSIYHFIYIYINYIEKQSIIAILAAGLFIYILVLIFRRDR